MSRDCAVCESVATGIPIDAHWFLGIPGEDAPIAGWLTLAPLVHRETLAELSDAEADALGPLLREVSATVQAITGVARTYTANWAEATRHVHFHIVPRQDDLDAARLGFEVFRLLADDIDHPDRADQRRVLERVAVRVEGRRS